MIEHRPFNQLAGEDRGWPRAKRHIFFANCHDATRVGRGSLRVWNDDEIAPNAGFSPRPQADSAPASLKVAKRSNTRLANDVMATSCLPRSTACEDQAGGLRARSIPRQSRARVYVMQGTLRLGEFALLEFHNICAFKGA